MLACNFSLLLLLPDRLCHLCLSPMGHQIRGKAAGLCSEGAGHASPNEYFCKHVVTSKAAQGQNKNEGLAHV